MTVLRTHRPAMLIARGHLHTLVLPVYAGADLRALRAAVENNQDPGILYGSGRSRLRDRLRRLAADGAFVFLSGPIAGWSDDDWGAVLTAPGRCAAQRSAGETPTVVDFAGLDRGEAGTGTTESRLWCVEHGYLGRDRVRTDKTCPYPGTPFHDRGLDRV